MIYLAAVVLLFGWLLSEYWFSILLIILPFFVVPGAIGAAFSIASESESAIETVFAFLMNLVFAGASIYGFLWAIGAV